VSLLKMEEKININENSLWSEIDEINNNQLVSEDLLNWKTSRRHFLMLAGSGITAITLINACQNNPIKKIMPYYADSEKKIPGKISYYSSSCSICPVHCSIKIKTFENRPVKIEGNSNSELINGGLCVAVHASLYELYHEKRLKHPFIKAKLSSLAKTKSHLSQLIQNARISDSPIVVVSQSIQSAISNNLFSQLYLNEKNFYHYVHENQLNTQEISVYQRYYDTACNPLHQFEKAIIIVGFESDFLSNPLNVKKYLSGRDVDTSYTSSFHIQFESRYSKTGAFADKRYPANFHQQIDILKSLINEVQNPDIYKANANISDRDEAFPIRKLAKKLIEFRGRSIIISGIQDNYFQELCFKLNYLLGNHNRTITNVPVNQIVKGNIDFTEINEIVKGKSDSLVIFLNTDLIAVDKLNQLIQDTPQNKIKQVILTSFQSEICANAEVLIPDLHFTESWNCFHSHNELHICQAVIQPLVDGMQAEDILLMLNNHDTTVYEYFNNILEKDYFTLQNIYNNFQLYLKEVLHKGIIKITPPSTNNFPSKNDVIFDKGKSEKRVTTVLVYKMYPGNYYSYNPLLQELPDPVSKTSWINCSYVSSDFAKTLSLQNGDIIEIKKNNKTVLYPVCIQPGMADHVIAIPLEFTDINNKSIISITGNEDLHLPLILTTVTISKAHGNIKLIKTQQTTIINNTNLIPEFELNQYLGYKRSEERIKQISETKSKYSPQWAMVIDLNKCIACGACQISCQTENNIPIVGPTESGKHRQMHWIRIDRYYHGKISNPEIRFIPVMCQHCENAPCEPVCPVGASSHSQEGLNMQNYKRCIGARFCNANCPYTARTFNYKGYSQNEYFESEQLQLMLNPQVSIREKGVSEKCNFCIQRIQEAKREAKLTNDIIPEERMQTACSQSCPAGAILFGDISNPGSRVYRLSKGKRAFKLLHEKGTKPNVIYLSKVRNNIFLDNDES